MIRTDNYCSGCGSSVKKGTQNLGPFRAGSYVEFPKMYADYSIGFRDCDNFNTWVSRFCWSWKRQGTRKRKKGGIRTFQGYELKLDDFYFTSSLLNAFALARLHQIDEKFEDFCFGLAHEIVIWLASQKK